jgi:hypothetical protein
MLGAVEGVGWLAVEGDGRGCLHVARRFVCDIVQVVGKGWTDKTTAHGVVKKGASSLSTLGTYTTCIIPSFCTWP